MLAEIVITNSLTDILVVALLIVLIILVFKKV